MIPFTLWLALIWSSAINGVFRGGFAPLPPAIVSACRRCGSVGVQTGRAIDLAGDGKGLACPLCGDVVEASTVAVEHRLLAGEVLPALHRKIDVSRRDCGGSGFLDSGIS